MYDYDSPDDLVGRPAKRPRLLYTGPDQELREKRARNDLYLKSRFEAIFRKYGKDFSETADEIDLETGEIVVNKGHVLSMAAETDTGDKSPASRHGHAAHSPAPGDCEKDTKRLLESGQGNDGPILHILQQAVDPAWQAPPLPTDQRKNAHCPQDSPEWSVSIDRERSLSPEGGSLWAPVSAARGRPRRSSDTVLGKPQSKRLQLGNPRVRTCCRWTQKENDLLRHLRNTTTYTFNELQKYFPGRTGTSLASWWWRYVRGRPKPGMDYDTRIEFPQPEDYDELQEPSHKDKTPSKQMRPHGHQVRSFEGPTASFSTHRTSQSEKAKVEGQNHQQSSADLPFRDPNRKRPSRHSDLQASLRPAGEPVRTTETCRTKSLANSPISDTPVSKLLTEPEIFVGSPSQLSFDNTRAPRPSTGKGRPRKSKAQHHPPTASSSVVDHFSLSDDELGIAFRRAKGSPATSRIMNSLQGPTPLSLKRPRGSGLLRKATGPKAHKAVDADDGSEDELSTSVKTQRTQKVSSTAAEGSRRQTAAW